MAVYSFTTIWKINASLDAVWDAILAAPEWPNWWPGVKRVEVIHASSDPLGIGSIFRMTWKSPIPYSLTFDSTVTEVVPCGKIAGVVEGDLVGTGVWILSEENGTVTAEYDWNVHTTKLWMNLVAPIARPVFHLAHNWVMSSGEQGLKRLLARQAISVDE
jgi:hypothetical protein